MVRVHAMTTDKITAWRIRDALACHPLLGGGTAQIDVEVDHEQVILTGWATDERVLRLVEQLVRGAAGRHAISVQLYHGCLAGRLPSEAPEAMPLR